MSVTALTGEFMEIIAELYPGRGTIWGIDHPFLGDYSPATLNDFMARLKILKREAQNSGAAEPAQELFIRSINLRLFELEELREWKNRPVFYLEKSYGAITVFWSLYTYVIENKLNLEIAEARMAQLKSFFAQGRANLAGEKIGKLDCLYVISQLKEFEKFITAIGKRFTLADALIESCAESITEFTNFLSETARSMDYFLLPWGAEYLTQYIELETGILADFYSLAHEVEEILVTNCSFLSSSESPIGSREDSAQAVNETFLKAAAEKIFDLGQEWFGDSGNRFSNIYFRGPNPDLFQGTRGIGYLSNHPLATEQSGVFIYEPQFELLRKPAIDLNLVHEIYPGHHWMAQMRKSENAGNPAALIFENRAHSEGWAKYCEYFYAKYLFQKPEYVHTFQAELAKMALLAMAVIEIHVKGHSFGDIVNKLLVLTKLNSKRLNAIVLQAYLEPTQCLSYVLGFFAFKKELEKLSQPEWRLRVREILRKRQVFVGVI